MSQFYVAKPKIVWPDGINPKIMTREQLDAEVKKGVKLYNKLWPPGQGFFSKYGLYIVAAVAVGALAVHMMGPAAANGAATAAGEAATATGATASTAAATAKSAVLTTQKIAGTVKKVATLASAAGVKGADKVEAVTKGIEKLPDIPAKLDAAAEQLKKGVYVDGIADQLAKEALKMENYKIATPQAQAALIEQINREKLKYAEFLQREAAKRRTLQMAGEDIPLTPKKEPNYLGIASVAVPLVIALMG